MAGFRWHISLPSRFAPSGGGRHRASRTLIGPDGAQKPGTGPDGTDDGAETPKHARTERFAKAQADRTARRGQRSSGRYSV